MEQSGKMSKYIVFLLLSASVGVCSGELWKRLIPGTDCSNNERLHHVSLTKKGQIICGGTLIHKEWILTAGHCYKDGSAGIKVIVGVHPAQSGTRQTFTIASSNIKKYSNNLLDGDIMLLKLPKPINNIIPAQLPDIKCKLPSGTDVLRVSGHGSTTNVNGAAETNLKCLDVVLVPCQNLKGSEFEKDKHIICGGNLPNQPVIESCGGDSGGGLLLKDRGDVIFGVLIGGRRGGCARKIVFTDVCQYINWINGKINRP